MTGTSRVGRFTGLTNVFDGAHLGRIAIAALPGGLQ